MGATLALPELHIGSRAEERKSSPALTTDPRLYMRAYNYSHYIISDAMSSVKASYCVRRCRTELWSQQYR